MSQNNRADYLPVRLSEVAFASNLIMFLLGAATTVYGPTLIYIAAEAGRSVADIGVLFVLHWSGFFASTLTANRLGRRFEMRRAVVLGCLLVGLGALGLATLPFPLNLASALLIGLGAGTLEVLINRLIEFLALDEPGAALSRLHATWGLGAVAIPLVVAGVVRVGLGWRVAGGVLVGLAALTAAAVLRWPEVSAPHSGDIAWRHFPWRSTGLFVAMFVIYVGVESATGGWATTFFAKLGQGPFMGAIATSLFFLTFTIGRIVLASSIERLGYSRAVRLGCVLAAGALLLTMVPELALVGFGLAGIALSVVFPTLLAWAARSHPEIRAQMASVSIASAGLGGVVIPYAIGQGVGAFGPRSLTPMLVGTALVVGALTLLDPGQSART